jgi:tetratricopeptide (TPR) repeat protein
LTHDYTLDDAIVITKNEYVQEGFQGIGKIMSGDTFEGFFGQKKNLVSGGRYRPLSLISFAVEYQFFGLNPAISHLINILLYIATSILIFICLSAVFSNWKLPHPYSVAFIAMLIFLFHPVHTEVVANIKGRDEIMSLFFTLATFYYLLQYRKNKNFISLTGAFITFILALLSKESAFGFVILFPFIFLPDAHKQTKYIWQISGILILSFSVYFALRHQEVGGGTMQTSFELMNNSYIEASVREKWGTILLCLLLYLKLLIWPHPLTYDYYPYHIELTQITNTWPLIAMLVYLGMALAFFYALKNHKPISLGIAIFIVTLIPVSNIFFPIGTFMAERFLFFPSLGFSIIISYIAIKIWNHSDKTLYRKWLLIIGVLLFVSATYKTITRNRDWKNDYTLFSADVQTSANSAKGNTAYGGKLTEVGDTVQDTDRQQAIYKTAITHLRRALTIHPEYADAMNLLGNAYSMQGKHIDSALVQYLSALKINPGHAQALSNFKIVIKQMDESAQKANYYEQALALKPNDFDLNYGLGNTFGKELNRLELARQFLQKAHLLNKKHTGVLKDLGVAYALSGLFEESLNYFEKALELSPDDPGLMINIGLTHQQLGNMNLANRFFGKAEQLRTNNQ